MSLVHSCVPLVAIDALIAFLQPPGFRVFGLFDRQNGCLIGSLTGDLIISHRFGLDELFPAGTGMRFYQSCVHDHAFCNSDVMLTQLMIDLLKQLLVNSLF